MVHYRMNASLDWVPGQAEAAHRAASVHLDLFRSPSGSALPPDVALDRR